MIQEKVKQRAKPLLGNNEIQILDIVKSEKNTNETKVSKILSKQRCLTVIDHDRELFQGLKFKELGSIETADCEDPSFEEKELIKNFNENSLEREKIKLKLERIEKTKGSKRKMLTEPEEKHEIPNVTTLKQAKKDVENSQLKNVLRLSSFLSAQSKK